MDKNAAFRDKMWLQQQELRDYFAGQALAGTSNSTGWREPERLANECYRVADAMLVAREKYDSSE